MTTCSPVVSGLHRRAVCLALVVAAFTSGCASGAWNMRRQAGPGGDTLHIDCTSPRRCLRTAKEVCPDRFAVLRLEQIVDVEPQISYPVFHVPCFYPPLNWRYQMTARCLAPARESSKQAKLSGP